MNYADIGNLSLCNIVVLDKCYYDENGEMRLTSTTCPLSRGLEVVKWDKDRKSCYAIGSFKYNKSQEYWHFVEIDNRLLDEDIDWDDLRRIISTGHAILKNIDYHE